MSSGTLEHGGDPRHNTRFAPTPAGGLHLGHVWVAWLNHDIAHRQGGKFILRLDTVLARYFRIPEAEIEASCETIVRELEWMGLPPDSVVREDEYQGMVATFLDRHVDIPREPIEMNWTISRYGNAPKSQCLLHVTPSRVVCDHILRCAPIVRGDDLLFEHWWYVYLCHRFGLPVPDMAYVPRVCNGSGDDLSRSAGNAAVAELRRACWTPDDVRRTIRQTCLTDPDGEIRLENVHRSPVLKAVRPCD